MNYLLAVYLQAHLWQANEWDNKMIETYGLVIFCQERQKRQAHEFKAMNHSDFNKTNTNTFSPVTLESMDQYP